MTNNKPFKLALLCCLTLITACSITQPQPSDLRGLGENSHIKHWQIRGKLGLRSSNRADSVYINWQQCQNNFDIRITGPFGQGAARLYGNTEQVILENDKQQVFHAQSPEQLLQQQLGWSFPVSQLYYWLRAIPAPATPYKLSDNSTDFSQQGWQLRYPRFETINNHQLPTKIIAEQTPLKVTLIIKQWQLQPCELAL